MFDPGNFWCANNINEHPQFWKLPEEDLKKIAGLVMSQAISDAFYRGDKKDMIFEKDNALDWLTRPSKMLEIWCTILDVNMNQFIKIFWDHYKNGNKLDIPMRSVS